jgi:arylsulfate sulfotransferase
LFFFEVTSMRRYISLSFSALLALIAVSSAALAQTATTTDLKITPSSSIPQGQNATLTATVIPSSGSTPTGTVGFYSGTTLFATVSLNGGVASLTESSATLAPGTYNVFAKYNATQADASSTSNTIVATVTNNTTTSVSAASTVLTVGQVAQVTAAVSSNAGTPTGTVSFYVGSTPIGIASLVNGSATFSGSTSGIKPGVYPVTADYNGNSTFAPSSARVSITLDSAFTISPVSAAISPSATEQFSTSPSGYGPINWAVNGVIGGDASYGTISNSGLYTAPATSSALTVHVSASLGTDTRYAPASVPVYVIPSGAVTTTSNGQVASYTINAPGGSSVSVNFGTTTSYGLNTWTVPTPADGGPTTVLVAGMLANTLYDIQGVVSLPDGTTFSDANKTFTTTQSVTSGTATFTATTTPGKTPQPGIEIMSALALGYAIDLDGNTIWAIPFIGTTTTDDLNPIKPLANGDYINVIGALSQDPLNPPSILPGTNEVIQEVDLTGTTVRELDIATLQTNLTAAGYDLTLQTLHHDVTINPVTGHWIVLSNVFQTFQSVTGESGPQNVLGDVIIDVDPSNNFAVDWVWNAFDHLDVNRHPFMFPDWTHANAIVYSPSDHQLIVSIRHQNWVVKLDYEDAGGSGNILWHLGYEGDFSLVNGTSPQDWQYAQHGPNLTTPNSSGSFGLAIMDNGDDRVFPANFTCPVALTQNICLYSRAIAYQVDENTLTATLTTNNLSPYYSFFGGDAHVLANGDLEYDFAGANVNGTDEGYIAEYTPGANSQLVFSLLANGQEEYRAFRQGSLYPGVSWSAEALRFQAAHATHPNKK